MSEIKINDTYSIERDPRCWMLRESYEATNRDGETNERTRTTYHGTLAQVSVHIINQMAGDCDSLVEIVQLLMAAETIVTAGLETLTEEEE